MDWQDFKKHLERLDIGTGVQNLFHFSKRKPVSFTVIRRGKYLFDVSVSDVSPAAGTSGIVYDTTGGRTNQTLSRVEKSFQVVRRDGRLRPTAMDRAQEGYVLKSRLDPDDRVALFKVADGRQEVRWRTPTAKQTWRQRMEKLQNLGLVTFDGHGGYEVTAKKRAAVERYRRMEG